LGKGEKRKYLATDLHRQKNKKIKDKWGNLGKGEKRKYWTQIFTDDSITVILRAKPEESQNRDSSLCSE